jgi:hypothetical protein
MSRLRTQMSLEADPIRQMHVTMASGGWAMGRLAVASRQPTNAHGTAAGQVLVGDVYPSRFVCAWLAVRDRTALRS